jgi:hypothetical protein
MLRAGEQDAANLAGLVSRVHRPHLRRRKEQFLGLRELVEEEVGGLGTVVDPPLMDLLDLLPGALGDSNFTAAAGAV